MASWAWLALFTAIIFIVSRQISQKRTGKLPPGPKPLPLLGNIRDFPPDGVPEYEHWLKHKDLYGGISSVTVMGMTLVIIHDKKIAEDLLEHNASKTSGRPEMVMANQICGYGSIVLCQGYNPTFRRYRKYLHQELGTKSSAAQFRGVQETEVKRQLVRAMREPEKWLQHFKTTAAATVLKMAYGYKIEPDKQDSLVRISDTVLKEFSLAAAPMAWVVDIIPALQYLPQGFPGATFQKMAQKWRHSVQAGANIPYRFVRRQMDAGTNQTSYVSKLVESLKDKDCDSLSQDDEHAIIWSAFSLYGAAADTSVIILTAFTLAMMKFKHIQRKAQEEIDRVVGNDRLPTFDDRDKLPYVNAIIKETMRWWPIAPLGFPHTATEEIEYGDMSIPKGSYLLPAVWWFLHDPAVYANPQEFCPERFLSPRNEPDPTHDVFGYGRRACPGRFFADASLYLNISSSLAAFDISKPVDAEGKEVDVDVKPKPGILTYPTDFDVRVRPRSDKHEALIRENEKTVNWEEGDSELLESFEEFKT